MNSDSPNTADIVELAVRCEQATGPSDELQFAIAKAVGAIEEAAPFQADGTGVKSCPAYTHSLDAAMRLVPDDYRLASFGEEAFDDEPRPWVATLALRNGRFGRAGVFGRAATPALALCATSLKARAALKDHRKAQPVQPRTQAGPSS